LDRVSGYTIKGEKHRGRRFIIYSGMRERDGRPVLLKVPIVRPPEAADIGRLRHEHDIRRAVAGAGAAEVLELEELPNQCVALVLEDTGGVSLRQFQAGRRIDAVAFCRLAISCATSLGRVHRAGIVHRDITPDHVTVHPERLEAKLTGFGAASWTSREAAAGRGSQAALESDPRYTSPEQTGRMNRSVDHRSDLYSLGATLYELLAGQPPFDAADPADLVYAHIASPPQPPVEISPEVPLPLSGIVLRLLAKTAEERYQGTHGLIADLERCLRLLQESGRIPDFPLGGEDFSTQLTLPHKLYGREAERQALVGAFERATQGERRALLISGYAGIGKSSLVGELGRPIAGRRGYFAAGKFDQVNRATPYQAFTQAFQDVARKILTESSERVEAWGARLGERLAPNAQVVIDAVPELERIMGAQPPVVPLGGNQAEVRFNMVFRDFVRTLASREHPLAIFLDDLQWADAASLGLLRQLLTDPDLGHFLFIGAFRDNEVGPDHPLARLVADLAASNAGAESMVLAPLRLDDVGALLADALRAAPDEVRALAELVTGKTGGNPFFVRQFLATLHRKHLVEMVPDQRRWRWDLDRIRREDITDNVVDLMSARIQALGDDARAVAQSAACLGNAFDHHALSLAFGDARARLQKGLQELLDEQLVVSAGGAGDAFRFLHDRVQQAAYASVPAAERPALHLRIGRVLLDDAPEQRLEDRVFEIVSHLGQAVDLMRESDERAELAALSLLAARKAKRSAAFEPAMRYATSGLTALGPSAWEHALSFELHLEGAEASHLCARYDESQRLVDAAFAHAGSVEERLQALEVRLDCLSAQARWEEVFEVASQALALTGEPLQRRPTREEAARALGEVAAMLHGRSDGDLRGLPAMADPASLASMRILLRILPAAYILSREVFPLIIHGLVRRSLQHGAAVGTALGFVCYGQVLSMRREYELAFRYGRLAMQLLERFPADPGKAKVPFIFNVFIRHWKEPLAQTIPAFLDTAQLALETGVLDFFSYCHMSANRYALYCGQELSSVRAQLDRSMRAVGEYQLQRGFLDMLGLRHLLDELQHPEIHPRPEGDRSDAALEAHWVRVGDHNCLGHLHESRAVAAYFQGDLRRSLEHFDRYDECLDAIEPSAGVPFGLFYEALVRLALAAEETGERRGRLLARVDAIHQRFTAWTTLSPANFAHRLHLLDAERASLLDTDANEAEHHYEQAIALAETNGFLHDHALAHELAARHYLRRGLAGNARAHLGEAVRLFKCWGARVHVDLLQQRHPDLLSAASAPPSAPGAGGSVFAMAADALGTETIMGDLLKKLLNITMHDVGARRAVLLQPRDGGFRVVAELGPKEPVVLQQSPGALAFPEEIANFCVHTGEPILLNDAAHEGPFSGDPYVCCHQPRSVLCSPLTFQGKTMGLVYLENALAAGVFTTDALQMVQHLSNLAGLALRNHELTKAHSRFVPHQFLRSLNRSNIAEVQRGECVQREVSVLFSNMRGFHGMQQSLQPPQILRFLNDYLEHIEPPIEQERGFIDSFVGDGVTALFDGTADGAVRAAIGIQLTLRRYNAGRIQSGKSPVETGIGISTGNVLLGTFGGSSWLKCGVIGDAVNLSSQVEKLAAKYGASVLMTEHTLRRLEDPSRFSVRLLDRVPFGGDRQPVALYEVLDCEPPEIRRLKELTRARYEEALAHYYRLKYGRAFALFQGIATESPADTAAIWFAGECKKLEPFDVELD